MTNNTSKDIILIGAGIMSTTLGSFLKNLEGGWTIKLFERLDVPANESSHETNNAGTGHAALCELNYTVEQPDGSIDIEKAKSINEQFEISKQFWSFLVKNNHIQDPSAFIRPLPHISFVTGKENVDYLKRRFDVLSIHHMFQGMDYTEDKNIMKEWIPLMMEGRSPDEPVAASKINSGTDVNFGELTRRLAKNIESHENAAVFYQHEVLNLRQLDNGKWEAEVRDLNTNKIEYHIADYIFIGAGGHAIPLLQNTGIPESKHLGGFPISGAFLVCNNPEVVHRHNAKVYGKEPHGTPPMTVPHLDRRYMGSKESLLFGPFAAIGPKFLKNGSNLDLFKSIKTDNLLTMMSAGVKNLPLVKYSIQQVLMRKDDRMQELRRFVPDAKDEDWDLHIAGKRVQVIKDTEEHGRGFIQFGTEVVSSEDNSMIALLGESPGASVSVSVALEVFKKSFPEYIEKWDAKLKEMIPSYGQSLIEDSELLLEIRQMTAADLKLE
ncbi:putative malate:quinone oxidoreductase 2 [Jeotgalicoccus aerolatus]|uniref:Probable malate:quinone oxidoreductase n=1 Tax=Jeotgalicoccus aerolatus TaxID=709510 RepID=A0ABS4HQX6_9STAP|nr:malate dehydrogenase (quinone) [Jeotgalicoccus aerolatus]MBP1953119.1 malate dehydrogenase (quinone) [Jeotgalicoccus aerolatus]NMA81857.1 malate dehydrogenase (quinone) [Jeotgalicoccus aerolatus]CAD2073007.1 putative malate:quinone oxidoreductase 2 [Jeotgalicoccus aerolatus]GGE02608.1 putative malate:quinone oxidoreductase 2 [Jeotgalicoccus aerolatus]HJG33984.1 malate dehydrogenase (quinone) [Jeotgalicoccus aerolatus]